MATNMFTDSTAVDGSIGFGFAPPPQTLVDDVQITFDTEMMDEDEALALQQQQQAPPPPTVQPNAGIGIGGIGGEEVRLVDATGDMGMEMGMDTDTVQVVAEKIHLRGVDTMATGDIEHWERKWVGDGGGLKRVEWIDDSSCKRTVDCFHRLLTVWWEGEVEGERWRDWLYGSTGWGERRRRTCPIFYR